MAKKDNELAMAKIIKLMEKLEGSMAALDPVSDVGMLCKLSVQYNTLAEKLIKLDQVSEARENESHEEKIKRMEFEHDLEVKKLELATTEKVAEINSKATIKSSLLRSLIDLGSSTLQVASYTANSLSSRKSAEDLGYACLGITENSIVADKIGYQNAIKSLEKTADKF